MKKSTARWGVVSVFALASTWNYLDRNILAAAVPLVRAEFHLSNAQYGWVLSVFSLAYALASPATGWLLDWLGVEIAMAWAVVLWSATSVLEWTEPRLRTVARRAYAVGRVESAGVPAAGKLNAAYLEPKNRAIGAAMTQVGLSIAGIAGPWLVAVLPGWRQPSSFAPRWDLFGCRCSWCSRQQVAPFEVVPPWRERRPGNFLAIATPANSGDREHALDGQLFCGPTGLQPT